MTNCREVICPVCEHKFMWMNVTKLPQPTYYYRNRKTDEHMNEAICPQCRQEIIVEKELLVGVIPDEAVYERIGIRGI